MKKITMLQKSIKWTNQKRHQSHKSLKHTLRISKDGVKKAFDWDIDLSHTNLISMNGNITKLDDEDGQKVYDSVIKKIEDDENNYNNKQTNNQVNISKDQVKKRDLKRKIKSYMVELNEEAWKKIDSNSLLEIEYFIKIIEDSDLKRQKQKISQLEEYINLHNKYDVENVRTKKKNSKATEMVEVFFKFPNHNKISEVSGKEYINTIENYFKQYFPDYEIFFTVFHGDEKTAQVEYGEHPHIFLNGRSSKTGEFGFAKRQTELVNSYLENQNKSLSKENQHKLFPKKLDYTQMIALGEVWQEIFYRYVNKTLLHKKGIKAEVKERTEEEKALREQIKKDAHLPKSERAYNLYTLAQEENKKLQEDNEKLTKLNKQLNSTKNKNETEITKVRDEKIELEKQKDLLKIEVDSQTEIIKEYEFITKMDLEDRTDEIIKKNYTLWKNINEEDLKKDLKPFIKTAVMEFSSTTHEKLIKQIEKTKSLEVVNTKQSHEICDLKRVMEKMDLAENMEKSDLKSELEEVKKENEKLVKKVSKLEAIKKQFENFIEEAENGMFKLLKEITTFKLSDLFPTLSKPLLDRVIKKRTVDLEEDIENKEQEELTEEEEGKPKQEEDEDSGLK